METFYRGRFSGIYWKSTSYFVYKNKLHSPQSFAKEYVGIDPQDYIEITSFSHLTFYEMVELKIPANWNNKKYYNVPIEDFESILDHALENGFSLAWDGDATEPLFDFETGILELTKMEEESIIEQKFRQEQFENKSTTDDHNMHIIGKAKNADDKIYYILKNSEGTNGLDGYIYMTKNALLLKTISLLVHKDAIPKHIKK